MQLTPAASGCEKSEDFSSCAGKPAGKLSDVLTRGCLGASTTLVIRQEFTTVFRDVNWVTASQAGTHACPGYRPSPV